MSSLRTAIIGLAILGSEAAAAIANAKDPVLAMAEAIRPTYKGPAPRTAPRGADGRRIRAKRTDVTPPPGPRHFGYYKVHNPYDPVVGAHVKGFRWVELTAPRS